LAFILGSLFYGIYKNKNTVLPKFDKEILKKKLSSRILIKRFNIIYLIFLFGILFEIIFFGGAPGLGILGLGSEIIYTDFGISGLHGLINSLFYTICVINFARYILGVSKNYKIILILSLIYPFITMSRQVLISILIQYILIYIALKKIYKTSYFKFSIVILIVFLIFGYLGDIRSGRENFLLLSQPSFDYPAWLPSGFLWVYMYLCTPLNNVNHNIDISPNYLPFETGATLIPTFARQYVVDFFGGGNSQWELVTESFNVSSLLQSFLTDFGIIGTILLCFTLGLLFSIVLNRATKKPSYFFILIVILHGLVLSFFANLLFHLVFLFEMLTLYILLNFKDSHRCVHIP